MCSYVNPLLGLLIGVIGGLLGVIRVIRIYLIFLLSRTTEPYGSLLIFQGLSNKVSFRKNGPGIIEIMGGGGYWGYIRVISIITLNFQLFYSRT
jgi:hypothetical protein